ncbi:MAG: SPASM domain-containing protein [Candidatus Omnitrophica bacterium]|nr:SPASM domain-containing protein [Candidatus Omnitrophota bacterium]
MIRACGIVFCYNEENILRDNLAYYLSEGIDLVIFDNASTDRSPAIIAEFKQKKDDFRGKIIDVVRIATVGYEWQKILIAACEYMHKNLQGYDWILIIDSDGFYYSPVKGMSLLEFLSSAAKYGYNVINGKVYEFYPTEKDDYAIVSPTQRMHYCQPKFQELLYVNEKHHRIFQYDPSIDFYTTFGHGIRRANCRVLNKVKYIYKHYPWVSFEHGLKKIFKERKPRYVERKFGSILHKQYMGMLPIEKDFIKHSQELLLYRNEKVLMPAFKFFWIMQLGKISDSFAPVFMWLDFLRPMHRIISLPRIIKKTFEAFGRILNSLPYANAGRLVATMIRQFKQDLSNEKKSSGEAAKKVSIIQALRIKILSYGSVIFQHPIALNYPSIYHFLMTNFCNAACVFCNQPPQASLERKEITLDMFKTMVSHIPPETPNIFYLSGGGEPFLAKDLFPIIQYVNTTLPAVDVYIRTNGILLSRYARQLAEVNVFRLEISVHGCVSVNDGIIQRNLSAGIFDGIRLLNEHCSVSKKPMHKVFCVSLSRINIEDLPALITKAHELGVEEIDTFFCRFYPGYEKNMGEKLKKEDSLYFHKELYNTVILKSRKLARSLGIRFEHEPLFNKKFKEKPCFLPWRTVLVDWQGDVYPCTGGEVWFEKQVKSGRYNFGNLLREEVYQFWTNEDFIKIRRTCNIKNKENFIPECFDCHNTICFKGADREQGHFLAMHNERPNVTKA